MSPNKTQIRELQLAYDNLLMHNKKNEVYLFNIMKANLPVTFYWVDREGTVLGCNNMQATLYGLTSPEDLIGKNIYYLGELLGWPNDICEKVRKNDLEVMSTGKNISFEEEALINGQHKVFLSYKTPLTDEKGSVLGVFGFSIDITDRKKSEIAVQNALKMAKDANTTKTEFIRNMSHDIRTPLSGIQQTMRAISEGKIPEPDIPGYAFSAWEASKKLMELFNKIIDVSKNETFDFEDTVVKFDLYDLLIGLQKTYSVIALHKKIDFMIEHTPNVPQYLLGKHFRLHRILMNLLGNALKFIEKGSVRLLVEKADESDGSVVLRFSVIDTGPGISQDKHAMIFEPFSRLTPSFTGQYPGSGLGLHIVKEYVNKMQGEIYLESSLGEGAMFTCVLPFKRPILNNDNDVVDIEDLEDSSVHDIMPLQSSSFANRATDATVEHNKRALLVEDFVLAQNMGRLILSDIGYEVDVAQSGEEALVLTEKTLYDIIYIDIGLPGIDGIETIRRIRNSSHNLNKNTFAAALTAHADDIISEQCFNVGMQEMIFKPLSPEKAIKLHQRLFSNELLADAKSIVDFDAWRALLGKNAYQLSDLFSLFAEALITQRDELIEAYEKHDLNAVKTIAHKIKGGVKYCAFPRLEAIIIALESAAKNNDDDIKSHYDNTLIAIEQVIKAHRDYGLKG